MPIVIALPMPFATPTGQATHLEIDSYSCAPRGRWIQMDYFPGQTVEQDGETAFRRDPDFPVGLRIRIEGDQYDRFRAWAVAQGEAEDAPMYGALWNVRTVMRWIGWRQFRERLSQAEWDAMLPALTAFLGTNPPEEP